MPQNHDINQKSRLGTLLLHKGLITREQLDSALAVQASSGLRLGEVLIEKQWITSSQLNKALSHQSRYRLFATIGAMLIGTVQPLISYAATPLPNQPAISESQSNGLVPLSDLDMGEITARGATDNLNFLNDFANTAVENDPSAEQALRDVLETLFPGTKLFSDYTISGVEYYDGEQPRLTVNEDGSIKIQAPKRIAEIAFNDFSIKGSDGPILGDLIIRDIQMTADSNITIAAR